MDNSKHDKVIAIVLAAGSGKRMGSKVKKQYLLLMDKPVLYYTLMAFEASAVDEVILVVGEDDIEYCNSNIIEKYKFKKVTSIVVGGKERYHSVYKGLSFIQNCDYVLIHDGARPFVTVSLINKCIMDVKEYQATIVGVPSKDTVRIISSDGIINETLERSTVWNIQTPQCFSYPLIKKGYADFLNKHECNMHNKDDLDISYESVMDGTDKSFTITDDAMVIEYTSNHPIHITMGDYRNIKITTIEDLVLGEAFLNEKIKSEKK